MIQKYNFCLVWQIKRVFEYCRNIENVYFYAEDAKIQTIIEKNAFCSTFSPQNKKKYSLLGQNGANDEVYGWHFDEALGISMLNSCLEGSTSYQTKYIARYCLTDSSPHASNPGLCPGLRPLCLVQPYRLTDAWDRPHRQQEIHPFS